MSSLPFAISRSHSPGNPIRKGGFRVRIRPHFVVALTLKTARYADRIRVLLVSIDASHNLRHFLNLVNCAF